MTLPILTLTPTYAVPKTVTIPMKGTKLGDGYEQLASVGMGGTLTDYNVATDYLSIANAASLVGQFKVWAGIQAFLWTPDPDTVEPKQFVCQQWQLTLTNASDRQLTATFKGVVK